MTLILGLDGGISSWGWAVWEKKNNNYTLLDLGSYIFPEGGQAADRTLAKSSRNRRQRARRRLDKLISLMVRYGLISPMSDIRDINPYACRYICATGKASKEELARALIHICKRRGYKGNHLQYDPKDTGVVKAGITKLDEAIKKANAPTLGCFLHLSKDQMKRFKDTSIYRADRRHYTEEFNVIQKQQSENHTLTEDQWQTLFDTIFWQRPLKPQEKGKCTFYPEEDRAYKASYIAQEFVLWQQLVNIKIQENGVSTFLTEDQRFTVYDKLFKSKTMGEGGLRKTLKLNDLQHINYFKSDADKLNGHASNYTLRQKNYFGPARFDSFDEDQKIEIISTLLLDDPDAFETAIDALTFLSQAEREMLEDKAGEILSKLPKSTTNLSEKAMKEMLPLLKKGMHYHKAVEAITGGTHTLDDWDGSLRTLPYYGKVLTEHCMHKSRRSKNVPEEATYGAIPNASVHIALNALKKVYNDLADRFGKIDEIHLELAREVGVNEAKRKDYIKQRDQNKKNNTFIVKDLIKNNIKPTGTNILKYKLWKELCGYGTENISACECTCIYSGEKLSFSRVFNENSDVEIEHILPLSRTLDDGYKNKILSLRSANSFKGNKSPYEAFAHSPNGYNWDAIVARAQLLPSDKRKRFFQEAMDVYESEKGFVSRALTDTKYITRIARRYLTSVCDPNKITCVNGRLTAKARHEWGLNSLLNENEADKKSRENHKHHAIDAATVALISKASVNIMSQASKNNIKLKWPEPFEGIRQILAEKLKTAPVVHKRNAKDSGTFFESTAYNQAEDGKVIYRKPITFIEKLKDIEYIRDHRIKEDLKKEITEDMGKKDIQEKIELYKKKTGIKSIRLIKKLDGLRDISSQDSKGVIHKKFLKPNTYLFMELWQWKEKNKIKVQPVPVSLYDIKAKTQRRPHPSAKKIMSVHKKDYIDLGEDIGIVTVTRLKTSSMFYIKPDDADGSTETSFSWAKVATQGKKVEITPTSIKG